MPAPSHADGSSVVCNFNVDVGTLRFSLMRVDLVVDACILGPEIEIIYPPDVSFSTADLSAICFNR